ncbi:MAG: enolase C-terminal domain-like protein [Burkholderiaceae bacterium]
MNAARLPGLTVRSLRCTPVKVPLRYVLGTSAAKVSAAPLLLLDLTTDEGVTGRGYVFAYRDGGAFAMARLLDDLAPLVVGQAVVPLATAAKLERSCALIGVTGIVRMALSLLDMALWDALAVAAGLPLAALLGGAPRPLPAYNSCGLGLANPQATADEAERLLESGFRAVKLRLGHALVADDLAVLRAVRKRLPDAVHIMADYNQALNLPEALRRGHALQGEGLAWLEEPIRHDDWRGNARIARELHLPLQLGENFNGPAAMAQAVDAQACDLVMPDLARIGGASGWMQAAGLAAAHGLPMSSHLMPEVSAQLLCATPTAHWLEWVDWADVLLAEPLRIENGMALPSDRPGSGLEWDAAAVQHHRLA